MNDHEIGQSAAPFGLPMPGPGDVIAEKYRIEAVLGEGKVIDRVERTVDSVRAQFALLEHRRVDAQVPVDHTAIEDVMRSSYRGLRTSEQQLLAGIDSMNVTFSRDLLLVRPS